MVVIQVGFKNVRYCNFSCKYVAVMIITFIGSVLNGDEEMMTACRKNQIFMLLLFTLFCTFQLAGETRGSGTSGVRTVHRGVLLQMFRSGGYTYLEYESEGKIFWAASKAVVANIGDTIEFLNPLLMKEFHSRTLDRTFEQIYFAGSVRAVGKPGETPIEAKPTPMPRTPPQSGRSLPAPQPGIVKKATGVYTIAECFHKEKELGGKNVLIRGVVVKFTPGIKGTNWAHLRDGSGEAGKNDLTFTTGEYLENGDKVLLSGLLVFRKDIGSGYVFPLFMDNPVLTKEK
jgi:hypothetical protein